MADIIEIDFWGIYERGVPNQERIVFKPRIRIHLTNYLVVLGLRTKDGRLAPFPKMVYFFQETIIEPPTWVFLFTGPGTTIVSTETHTGEPSHNLFWGNKNVVFSNPDTTAAIIRLDSVSIAPKDLRRIDTAQLQLPLQSKPLLPKK